ncbi:MAG: anaerobic carbon-monoxide dehydrogenase catalytic subunit [Euryarchaeota archaeon]|nr:anaerobic carbon-monoxide dehydrogenase catalytic subunit [Euryarchaeota archaeon]
MKTIDKATEKMISIAEENLIDTAFDRLDLQLPQCGFGELDLCCRDCNMGTCRIDPFMELPGKGPKRGVCGLTDDMMSARNFLKLVTRGTSAHATAAKNVSTVFKGVAEGKVPYQVVDDEKLKEVLEKLECEDVSCLSERALADFSKDEGTLNFLKMIPEDLINLWQKLDILPTNINQEIVEGAFRLNFGVGADPYDQILHALKLGIVDGASLFISSELQDILFGTPQPKEGESNFGTLNKDYVNIVAIGHAPVLFEKIYEATRNPEIRKYAEEKGANGIEVYGMMCAGNELFVRHGTPMLGNFLQQEFAALTGAVEAVVVDSGCVMPALVETASDFHTKIITTTKEAKIPGAEHIEFDYEKADEIAAQIVNIAIDNLENRKEARINIPKEKTSFTGGYSKLPADKIASAIADGEIKGIVLLWGCNNPKTVHDRSHVEITKGLIKNDCLVFGTGCWSYAAAKSGILTEATELSGDNIRRFCEDAGIPPVVHLGSYVDTSRFCSLVLEVAKALEKPIKEIPVVTCAPEWSSEMEVATSMFFVALGIPNVFGVTHPAGVANVRDILATKFEDTTGGKILFEKEPERTVDVILDNLKGRG